MNIRSTKRQKKKQHQKTLVTVSHMESENETHGIGECSSASTEDWIKKITFQEN